MPADTPLTPEWATTMSILDARNLAFREQYPYGCHVYDVWGRPIRFVQICNPETGEVVRMVPAINGTALAVNVSGGPWRRHGFWPAPLRLVPLP